MVKDDSIRFDSTTPSHSERNHPRIPPPRIHEPRSSLFLVVVSVLDSRRRRRGRYATVGPAHKEHSDVPVCFLSFGDLGRVAVEELCCYRISLSIVRRRQCIIVSHSMQSNTSNRCHMEPMSYSSRNHHHHHHQHRQYHGH